MNYTGDSQKFIKAFELVVWITMGKGAYTNLPENPLLRHNVIACPVLAKGEMCFTSDGARVNITQKPLSLMRFLINTFCPPGANSRVLSLGSGSGTDAIAAAQVGRSSISLERDPIQYVQSVARAQAALARHDEKVSEMTELEATLVSGHMYFEPPPPHAGPSFLWTVPLTQSQSIESTDSSIASQASGSTEVTGSQSDDRMCSECGSKVTGPPFELCSRMQCQRVMCKRCWAVDELCRKHEFCSSDCMPALPDDD